VNDIGPISNHLLAPDRARGSVRVPCLPIGYRLGGYAVGLEVPGAALESN
jgi:hypothetical protein